MDHPILLVLSIIGFAIAYHIWHTKKNNGQLYCIIGKNCNTVIYSDNSEHLGIENSVLGMMYYVFVILMSLAMIFLPMVFHISFFMTGFTIIAGAAALFSLYLAGVQLFKLRELCEYCLANTAIVIVIFLVLLLGDFQQVF